MLINLKGPSVRSPDAPRSCFLLRLICSSARTARCAAGAWTCWPSPRRPSSSSTSSQRLWPPPASRFHRQQSIHDLAEYMQCYANVDGKLSFYQIFICLLPICKNYGWFRMTSTTSWLVPRRGQFTQLADMDQGCMSYYLLGAKLPFQTNFSRPAIISVSQLSDYRSAEH